MKFKALAMAIGIVGAGLAWGVESASAGYRYYDCVQHRVLGNMVITTVGTCSEWVAEAPVMPRRLPGNAWIDSNANLRSGASGESGVMFQTTRQERIKVYSWSEDGQWAWVGIWRGEGYVSAWTHKVNVTLDSVPND